jgi:hypothetical protein
LATVAQRKFYKIILRSICTASKRQRRHKRTAARANLFAERHAPPNTAATNNPYFIGCFATLTRNARGVVACQSNAMLRVKIVASNARDVSRERHVHTTINGVSVFFIALV